jgi:aldehyde:ferredoxin oxidoreductase
MTEMGGFAGNILYVDLTREQIRREPLDKELAEKFIGGLGTSLKLAYDRITPGTPAFSPENPIILGAGPLVGTHLPSSTRVYAVTKLPTSGSVGWCGGGGVTFGCMMKNAGFDHIVIEGQARNPVYLNIMDDQIDLVSAAHLWGKGIEETCERIRRSSPSPSGVLSIGQAGENQCTFSMAFIDKIATLGRGGFGAVMGSKNLKAIVTHGTGGIRVADRKKYNTLSKAFLQKIREYPYLKEWQHLGMVRSSSPQAEIYERIKKRRAACISCPIGCKDIVEIPDGPLKGMVVGTTSALNLFSPLAYGFKDYREGIKLISTLNDYGLDMFEFFGVMAFAKTLCDRGFINGEQAHPEIKNGSLDSMLNWSRKIAFREGLGDILAGGFNAIIEEYGENSKQYAPTMIKGMHPYTGPGSAMPWNLFGTMELGQMLDPRGPHVGSGGSPTYFAKRPLEVFPKHFERMGVPLDAYDRIIPMLAEPEKEQTLNVGRLLKYSHSWFTILGTLGICARAQINRFYNASLCADLYEAVSGIPTDLPGLRSRIDRVWTLYKMINVREGFSRKDESPPAQWIGDSGFRDYATEKVLDRTSIENMISDYYEEWGWDRESGIPTEERLKQLGIDSI